MNTAGKTLARHVRRFAAVAVVLTMATLGVQAPANAAGPVFVSCTLSVIEPTPGAYIGTGGRWDCNWSVEILTMRVQVFRDGVLLFDQSSTAQRRPGNKLLSMILFLGPACQNGVYQTIASGTVPTYGWNRTTVGAQVPITC